MKTLREVLSLSKGYLAERGVSSPLRTAQEILAFVLGKKRLELYMDLEYPLLERELDAVRSCLQRAGAFEPLEYIFSKIFFYDCEIFLTRDVLIPRVETELLVDKIAGVLLAEPFLDDKVLVDVCAGSGCIGVSLKKKFPQLRVFLLDVSEKALEVAKKNSLHNGVYVECVQSDLLSFFSSKKIDFLVSNPPYIKEEDYMSLDRSVREYEPKIALVGGDSGLVFYERLAEQIPLCVKSGGSIFFEIGTGQGEEVKRLFSKACWKKQEVLFDYAGHERFFFLEIE